MYVQMEDCQHLYQIIQIECLFKKLSLNIDDLKSKLTTMAFWQPYETSADVKDPAKEYRNEEREKQKLIEERNHRTTTAHLSKLQIMLAAVSTTVLASLQVVLFLLG